MTPGDFVRTTKQILDLLRQIREVAPSQASATAAAAADAINRSVVAYTGV
jgi:ATP-dependent RNA helicase HelY